MLPKLNRENYYISPSIIHLGRKTRDELMKVEHFCIQNEHGKVAFEGPVNLIGLDLDEIVQINEREVLIYPNEKSKPRQGQGLNQAATVTLYNCFAKRDVEVFREKIKRLCERNESRFINWDEDTGIWVFSVRHF